MAEIRHRKVKTGFCKLCARETNKNVIDSSSQYEHRLSTNNYQSRIKTVFDWEEEKNFRKDFYDDGTMTFFWNGHTILALIVLSCVLIYYTLLSDTPPDFTSENNTKRALTAVACTYIMLTVIHTPDGPFRRPHPAFWRLVLAISSLYELFVVYLLFQDVDYGRQFFKYVDDNLGHPLPEKNYAGSCALYDSNSTDPFHNIWDKMDVFVPIHFFGWWLKALILRDFWFCNVISFMFEVLEYSLEHQLPNFSECWWDHWVMDFFVCNMLGIILGMKTLSYLSMKPYHWRGMWKIPGYKGKLKRIILQFTPHRWTDFDWRPTKSMKRWLATVLLIILFLAAEINMFYLKYIFWIPPNHKICTFKLGLLIAMGSVAMREGFQYLDDPNCKRLGQQFWLNCIIIISELLLIIKFEWQLISTPPPPYIRWIWYFGIFSLVVWTFWHFYIKPWLVKEHLRFQKNLVVTKSTSSQNLIANSVLLPSASD